MLCTPVFIFTSGSSALLGHPCCGLSIWLSLPAIFNTLFWVYANFFHKKTDKTRQYSKSAIFIWHQNGHGRLLGVQSINTGRPSLDGRAVRTVEFLTKFNSVFRYQRWLRRARTEDFSHLTRQKILYQSGIVVPYEKKLKRIMFKESMGLRVHLFGPILE